MNSYKRSWYESTFQFIESPAGVRARKRLQRDDTSNLGVITGVTAVGATYIGASLAMTNPYTAPIGVAALAVPDVAIFWVGYSVGNFIDEHI